jgi:putative tricarboxylic transport membrane protein
LRQSSRMNNSSRQKPFSPHQIVDLSVLLVLAGLIALYWWDARQASGHIINLILIAPLSICLLVLCVIEFVAQLRGKQPSAQDIEPFSSVWPVMVLFIAYVVSLPWLGFDVGTSLFIGAFLGVHGERRVLLLVAYSLSFGFLVALFFSNMLPYPMPMLLLPTAY